MGAQPQRSSYLRQLAHPGRAQLQDLLRVPHPAGLLHADLQLGPGRRVRGPAGPRLLRRPLRPALCAPEPGEGVGGGLRAAVRGVLPLLAGGHAAAREVRPRRQHSHRDHTFTTRSPEPRPGHHGLSVQDKNKEVWTMEFREEKV